MGRTLHPADHQEATGGGGARRGKGPRGGGIEGLEAGGDQPRGNRSATDGGGKEGEEEAGWRGVGEDQEKGSTAWA